MPNLYVFGSNGEGQLGIPAEDMVLKPVQVEQTPPLEGLKSIRNGDNHTIFHYQDGSVYGVGDNRKGQLVPQTNSPTRLEQPLRLRDGVRRVAATCESTAYLIPDERDPTQLRIFTEGAGHWGELGCGDTTDTSIFDEKTLALLDPLPDTVIDFTAGVWHYIAILADGSVYGWGKSRLGQLGEALASNGKVTMPELVENLPFKPVKAVCGKDFTFLLDAPSSGRHHLLGRDKFGIASSAPANLKDWKDVGATWHAIFVLFSDGRLVAWGKSNMWDLIPVNLPLIDRMAVGSDHILAVTKGDERLISWGWGKHGNCGDLERLEGKTRNDMVSGIWNEIEIPGKIGMIGAGFCTSFVVTE